MLWEWRKQRDRGARAALEAKPGRPRVDRIERENALLRLRIDCLETDLEYARKVIDSQATLSALLDGLTIDAASTEQPIVHRVKRR